MTLPTIVLPCAVELADTDAAGCAHNTAAVRWAERAEHRLLRRLGFHDILRIPRVRIEVTYRHTLRDADQFDLEFAIAKIGRTSISFEWLGRRGSEVVFEGRHTAVYVDELGKPLALPDVLTHLGDA